MSDHQLMTQVSQELGWLDRIKENFKFDLISQKLGLSEYSFLGLLSSVGIGFALGFLWKRYARYVIMAGGFIGILIILQYTELIHVDIKWNKLQEMTGLHMPAGQGSIATLMWLWIKENILLSVGILIGFLLGVKFN